MDNILKEALIIEATRAVTENIVKWMSSDGDIASRLRDGKRDAVEAFNKLDTANDNIPVFLQAMLAALTPLREFYEQMPGSQGEWQCSALAIIRREIERMTAENYRPDADALAAAKIILDKRLSFLRPHLNLPKK